MSTGRVGQGPQFRPQQPAIQKKDAKETRESKESKGTESKGGVSTGGKTGGVKAKGKTKDKDLGAVGGLLSGNDSWAVEDQEDGRRRKSRQFFDEGELPDVNAVPDDWDDELSNIENIRSEFRGQVASGLAAARSFTRGGASAPKERSAPSGHAVTAVKEPEEG